MRRFLLILTIAGLSLPVFAFDFPDLKGWKRTGKVMTYTADNLWEYINGAAEQYLSFDFQELVTCEIAKSGLIVTVDIYDMSEPINAFGIYNVERPGGTALEIGSEAVVSPPYQALLFKDRFYVKINTYEGELDIQNASDLLMKLAESIPGNSEMPAELDLLPLEGRIDGSAGYAREGFLGLSQLNHCLFAKYHGDPEFQVFLILPGDRDLESIWQKLEESWEPESIEGTQALIKQVPYRGLAGVFRRNGILLGVSDVQNLDTLKDKIRSLLR